MALKPILQQLDHDPLACREQALELACAPDTPPALALRARFIAAKALGRRDYLGSLKELHTLIPKLRRAELWSDWLAALDEAGGHAMVTGQINPAISFWARCLRGALEHHNGEAAVQALLGLGKAFWSIQDHESALHYHRHALDCSLALGLPGCLGPAYLCFSADLIALGRYHTALCALELAREPVKACSNPHWLAELHLYLATCQAELGLENAMNELEQAESLGNQLGFNWVLSQVSWQRYLLAQGTNPEQANRHLALALERAEAVNAQTLLEKYHLHAYLHHKAAQKPEAALRHFKAYLQHFEHNHDPHSPTQLSDSSRKLLRQLASHIELALHSLENSALGLALRSQNAQLSAISAVAHTDTLTGLANRRQLEDALVQLGQIGRYSLIMLDVDHFKQVNDQFGHACGDAVLARLGQLLARLCRQHELIARYGGEEFVLLLPDCGPSEGQRVAERLRAHIAAHDWSDTLPRAITASLGGASTHAGLRTPTQVLQAADAALYQAKLNGRNQVCWEGDGHV